MDGYGRLQKIITLHKASKLTRELAHNRLMDGPGSLNWAAFNLAVENGLCLVCAKWKRCVVRDCAQYTKDGKCTWFEAIKRQKGK